MIVLILVLLGLCFGSFVNALVWRLHEKKNWTTERSICVHCHQVLAWYDLIPIVSWGLLKGRCRYCNELISWQYPLVEILTGILFVLSYHYWPFGWGAVGQVSFGLWLAMVVVLMALTVYDLRWMLLPNKLVLVFTVLAGLQLVVRLVSEKDINVLLAAFWGVVCLFGFFYILFQISGGKWIGGGDVKLGVGLGLLVGGPLAALLVLFMASCFGTIVSLPLLIKHKKKATSKIPFGPFLIAATFIVYIFGTTLINWYKRQFLLL